MPVMIQTRFTATITWLGRVPHRDAPELATEGLTDMPLGFAGMEGEVHGGVTRPSCSRVLMLHPKGTEIHNTRQISIVSAEEMEVVATRLDLPQIDPHWLGASLVVQGIPDFSHIPPGSRLQGPDGCTLTVDIQNAPCHFPGLNIEKEVPGHGKGFKTAAKGLRGVTAWVEREGRLRMGDELRHFIPNQRGWQGEA